MSVRVTKLKNFNPLILSANSSTTVRGRASIKIENEPDEVVLIASSSNTAQLELYDDASGDFVETIQIPVELPHDGTEYLIINLLLKTYEAAPAGVLIRIRGWSQAEGEIQSFSVV